MLKPDLPIAARADDAAVIAIGGSAGALNLIFDLLITLPAGFPLPIVVVIHRSRNYQSSIEHLLDQKTSVRVKIAHDKEKMLPGVVYFAPANYHLLVEPDGTFALDHSEPVWFCRPSIDVTFQSLAEVYQSRVIGILLSGANEDGAEGLATIEKNHGLVIAQDPLDAEVKTMPEAGIRKCSNSMILSNLQLFQFINRVALPHIHHDNGQPD